MPITNDDDTRALFDAETTVVIGCSTTAGKPAHNILACMQRRGYRAVPVSPFHDEILGETAYDSLTDVDEGVDLVDAFRSPEKAGDIVNATIERATDRGDVEAVWLQLDIRGDDAAARAGEAELSFVRDKCFKVKRSRLA